MTTGILRPLKIDEVNSFGTWSNNNVNLFIYQQYDFMIYPDLKLNTELENIIINSYSKCKLDLLIQK